MTVSGDVVSETSLFAQQMAAVARSVDGQLNRLIPEPEVPEHRLQEAMRYAVLAGGKRLRPFLVVASAELFHVAAPQALRVAAAVEMIHAYSLVHDDLPCMDDDDLRRGQPTVHRRFDEATAVLAGDALLTLAFEVLAGEATHADAKVRGELVLGLARAAGHHGMVGGQMIDLDAERRTLEMGQVTRLQQLKTGALIAYCCEAGAALGRASEPERLALRAYAHDLGLVFQITDDLLDVEGDPDTVGKTVNKDAAAGKATLVSLLGVEPARTQAAMLSQQAVAHLDLFGKKAESLRELVRYVLRRKA